MADSKQVANLEKNQKIDNATAQQLAKILEILENIED
jgi:hypothetical protein